MSKINNFHKSLMIISCLSFISASLPVHAGGIALGSTRIIYPQGNKQVSLPISNSDSEGTYLIQSWVSNADDSKSADFVITPPLFVIHPKKENIIRIIYTGLGKLPTDRETIYYLNTKAVPSISSGSAKGSTLQIATQSVIKLFVRPKGLSINSLDAMKTIKCELKNGNLKFINPSPYFASLVQINVGSVKIKNTMIPPKGETSIPIIATDYSKITYMTVNDFGANSPKQTCKT